MRVWWIVAGIAVVAGLSGLSPGARGTDRATTFDEEAAARITPGQPSVRGDDPAWFFLNSELRQRALGAFWMRPWEEVAKNGGDPTVAIGAFRDALAERGVSLLAVPVPLKSTVYPEKLAESFGPGDPRSTAPFVTRLRMEGLPVTDAGTWMREWRAENPASKWFCAQDSHFSPDACVALAGRIVDEMGDLSVDLATIPAERRVSAEATSRGILSIEGDQVRGSKWEGSVEREALDVRFVSRGDPVEPWPDSPVLLLGDSHTLVFQEGEKAGMHARAAGLFDHLSLRFGFALDRVGVRGSGLVEARKQLFYHAAENPGYWDSKRLVIWVFSIREFTQSQDRFIPIPLAP